MLKLTTHKTITSLPALLQPGQRAVVLKFTAAWCGPCRTMAPIVAAAEARHPEAVFAEVDIDANPELATALHVTYIPQVIVVEGLGRSEQANNSDAISPPPNDTGYAPPYTSSLRAPFTDGSGTGYQFIIRRDFGWPDNPQVQVVAYDTAGGTEIFPP